MCRHLPQETLSCSILSHWDQQEALHLSILGRLNITQDMLPYDSISHIITDNVRRKTGLVITIKRDIARSSTFNYKSIQQGRDYDKDDNVSSEFSGHLRGCRLCVGVVIERFIDRLAGPNIVY
jgi:hypothetical protein